jgi:hypothetical protein
MRVTIRFASLFLALLQTENACAAVISTIENWDGANFVSAFGPTPTYGQTFTPTAALGTQLQSFSFWMANYSGAVGPPISGNITSHFSAYIMSWDGSEAVGSVLYESTPREVPAAPSVFTEFDFDTGGLNLTAGQQYVALISTLAYRDGDTTAKFGVVAGVDPSYTGGKFVYNNSGSDFTAITNAWPIAGITNGSDAAFRAVFSTVPEPPSAVCFAVFALVAIISVRRNSWRLP